MTPIWACRCGRSWASCSWKLNSNVCSRTCAICDFPLATRHRNGPTLAQQPAYARGSVPSETRHAALYTRYMRCPNCRGCIFRSRGRPRHTPATWRSARRRSAISRMSAACLAWKVTMPTRPSENTPATQVSGGRTEAPDRGHARARRAGHGHEWHACCWARADSLPSSVARKNRPRSGHLPRSLQPRRFARLTFHD